MIITRRIVLLLLFLIGAAELYYVAFVVNLKLYANEPTLAKAIGLESLPEDKQKAYWEFFERLGNDWDAVAWFGILTMFFVAVLAFLKAPAGSASRATGQEKFCPTSPRIRPRQAACLNRSLRAQPDGLKG